MCMVGGCGACSCVVLHGQTPFCTEEKGLGHGHRAVCQPILVVEYVSITAQYSVTWKYVINR